MIFLESKFQLQRRLTLFILSLVTILSVQCSDDSIAFDDAEDIARARISGTVFLDENSDLTGDVPLEGIVVLCGQDSSVTNAIDRETIPQNSLSLFSTTTNDVGYYEFPGLPPLHNYIITLLEIDRIVRVQDGSPDTAAGLYINKIPVSLTEEEHDRDNNFVVSLSVPGNESEFFIEGKLENNILRYPQVNFDWTNVSNKYFESYQETWLQAYADSIDLQVGRWEVRLHDVDLDNIVFPYQVKSTEGRISWFDHRVDDIINNNPNCLGVDNGCIFRLNLFTDGNTMTITSVQNDVIEGTFEGVFVIEGTGSTPYTDPSLNYNVEDGKYRIKFRRE